MNIVFEDSVVFEVPVQETTKKPQETIPEQPFQLEPYEELVAYAMAFLFEYINLGDEVSNPDIQKEVRHRCYLFLGGRKRIPFDEATRDYVRQLVPYLVQYVLKYPTEK